MSREKHEKGGRLLYVSYTTCFGGGDKACHCITSVLIALICINVDVHVGSVLSELFYFMSNKYVGMGTEKNISILTLYTRDVKNENTWRRLTI